MAVSDIRILPRYPPSLVATRYICVLAKMQLRGFIHAGSWSHISSNAFMLYVFGRSVEEEEGPFGVWATYIICALGTALSVLPCQPNP